MRNFITHIVSKFTDASQNATVGIFAASALLAFNIACLVIYNIRTMRGLLSSDAAAKNLIAAEMARFDEFFLKDWYYVNGDLWTFYSHLLILPLLPFFPNGFGLHAFAGIVTAILLLSMSWWLLRMLQTPVFSRVLMLAVLASGISGSMAWTLFGETAYGWVLLTSLIFLLLFVPLFAGGSEEGNQYVRVALLLGIAVLSLIVHLGNPTRALASFSLPVIGGLAALFLGTTSVTSQQRWQLWATRAALPFGALLIGGLTGTIVHSLLIGQLSNIAGAGSAAFIPLELVGRSVGYTALGLVSLLGGEPTPGLRLPTPPGVVALVRLVAAVLVIALPLWALRYYSNSLKPSQQFVAGFAVTAFAVVMVVCLLTNTPAYSESEAARASMRYFAPSLILLLLIFASIGHSIPSKVLRFAAIGLALVFGTSAWGVLVNPRTADALDRPFLMKLLRENGLKYGYASYWNAGVHTVLSNEEIRIRQVQMTDSGIIPMRHLSAGRWYQDQEWTGQTFLLLSEKEYLWVRDRGLLDCPSMPTKTLTASSMRIVVYPENLSKSLLGWDDDRSTFEHSLCLLPHTPRTVGKFTPEPRAIVSGPSDGPGFLMFGPYIFLREGDYSLRATLTIESQRNESAGVIDVTGESGLSKFAAASLPVQSGVYSVELPFTLPRDTPGVELRTWVSASATVTLKSVSLTRRGSLPPKTSSVVSPTDRR